MYVCLKAHLPSGTSLLSSKNAVSATTVTTPSLSSHSIVTAPSRWLMEFDCSVALESTFSAYNSKSIWSHYFKKGITYIRIREVRNPRFYLTCKFNNVENLCNFSSWYYNFKSYLLCPYSNISLSVFLEKGYISI